MRFVIVDNQSVNVVLLRSLLEKLWPSSPIWPKDNSTFNNWPAALQKLIELRREEWDPEQDCCVVFYDLALDEGNADFNTGVQQLETYIDTAMLHYVNIIFSLYAVDVPPSLRDLVDAVMDRRQLKDGKKQEKLKEVVRAAVRKWEARTSRRASISFVGQVTIVDSPEARRAQVALGSDGIVQMASEVAEEWTETKVRVLTGGYSGAFVIQVDGLQQNVHKSVICKAARDRQALREEVNGWKKAAGAYESQYELIPPFVQTSAKTIGSSEVDRFAYIVQSTVPGPTLERAVLSHFASGDSKWNPLERRMSPVFAKLREANKRALEGGCQERPMFPEFGISKSYAERIESSLAALGSLRAQCVAKGFLDESVEISDSSIKAFGKFVLNEWSATLSASELKSVPMYEQHGDLNPRNIILPSADRMLLIDFARYGLWPIAYDLVRLELQLFLRIVDAANYEDVFPERLRPWLSLWDANAEEHKDPCTPESAYLWISSRLRALQGELCQLAERKTGRNNLGRVVHLIRAHDAIKMTTYQESSWFKRLFFLIIAMESLIKSGVWAP
jgi:hypothetical protein